MNQGEYSPISGVYDLFTDGFDYDRYIEKIFARAPLPQTGIALDCGCGTGTLLLRLYERGFSCTGVDISEDMLAVASQKISDAGYRPHLVCQSLEQIDLYGAYDIAFCSLDTLNHLVYKRDMVSFIRRMYNFVEPGGYFVFDTKTEAAFGKTVGVRVEERDEVTLIIRGEFTSGMAYYDITAFQPDENGLFRREDSLVEERFYSAGEINPVLKSAGFDVCDRFDFCGRTVRICRKPEM